MKTVGIVLLLVHAAKASDIDVSGINRSLLFKELYKTAQLLSNVSPLRSHFNRISKSKAREYVGKYVGGIHGVVMNICVPSESGGNSMDAKGYNAAHGAGTAESVVNTIREKSSKKKFRRRIRCCFGLECDRRGCLQACANAGMGICICGAATAIGCAVGAAIDAGTAGATYSAEVTAAEDAHNTLVENINASFDHSFKAADNLNVGDYSINSKEAFDAAARVLNFTVDTKVSALYDNLKADLIAAGVDPDKIQVTCGGYRSHEISFASESGLKYILALDIEPEISVKYVTSSNNPECPDGMKCIEYGKVDEDGFYNAIMAEGADSNGVVAAKNTFDSSKNEVVDYYKIYHKDADLFYRDIIKDAIFGSPSANNGPAAGAGNSSVRDVFLKEVGNRYNIESALDARDASLEKASERYDAAMASVHRKTGAAVGAGVVTAAGAAGYSAARIALGDSEEEIPA